MKNITVYNFQDFHEIVSNYSEEMIFRGVSRKSYELVPKVGRKRYFSNSEVKSGSTSLDIYEQKLMSEFQNIALPFIDNIPKSEWEWWAVAQHYGLPTRFLDWTKNPLVAAYFAIEDCNMEEDCVVYASARKQFDVDIDLADYLSPLEIGEIFLFHPPHIAKRITAQSGLFTVHNNPTIPLDKTKITHSDDSKKKQGRNYKVDRIVIDRNFKKEFKNILNLYGWNQATIYPGLDGVTGYLDWLTIDAV
ncbi:MAG: FRG domain-containing protein [Bacteroidia bacterium]|jgi:hypothetical protein|nr:FRG domain-containing protein [Bacteroidia bacterium]